jgi:hypothetical protein
MDEKGVRAAPVGGEVFCSKFKAHECLTVRGLIESITP